MQLHRRGSRQAPTVVLSLYRRAPQRFHGLALIATNAFPDTPIPSELVLIDGAGHFLPEQRPEPVADAIRRLVGRAAERRGDDARSNRRR